MRRSFSSRTRGQHLPGRVFLQPGHDRPHGGRALSRHGRLDGRCRHGQPLASDGTSGIAGVTLEKPDGSGQALTGDGSYSFEAGVNGVYTVTVTDRAGNSTKRSITIGNIDSSTPGLDVSGGELSGRSLSLTVTAQQNGDSEVTVTVSRNGADPQEIPGGEYAVSESGTYTFTAKTQAGTQATVQKTVYDVRVGESAEVVVSGGRVAQRGNPDRPGYTFVEWYNEATGRAWDFGDTVTQSLVLVSRWTLDGRKWS